MVIKKSLLEVVRGYDERYEFAMDTDLFLRLLKFEPKIKIMREAVVFRAIRVFRSANGCQLLLNCEMSRSHTEGIFLQLLPFCC